MRTTRSSADHEMSLLLPSAHVRKKNAKYADRNDEIRRWSDGHGPDMSRVGSWEDPGRIQLKLMTYNCFNIHGIFMAEQNSKPYYKLAKYMCGTHVFKKNLKTTIIHVKTPTCRKRYIWKATK
jgi:hypothetical protein